MRLSAQHVRSELRQVLSPFQPASLEIGIDDLREMPVSRACVRMSVRPDSGRGKIEFGRLRDVFRRRNLHELHGKYVCVCVYVCFTGERVRILNDFNYFYINNPSFNFFTLINPRIVIVIGWKKKIAIIKYPFESHLRQCAIRINRSSG